jgi:hypothetical protein
MSEVADDGSRFGNVGISGTLRVPETITAPPGPFELQPVERVEQVLCV